MSLNASTSSFNKTLILAFGMMFGLVALALGYSVMNKDANTDIRSKAAEETTLYNQWEFNSVTTENWITNKPYTVSVNKGRLELSIVKADGVAVVKNLKAATQMPSGNKYLVMSLSVGDAIKSKPPVPTTCPSPPTCAGGQLSTDTDHPLRGGCPAYRCIPISTPTVSNSSNGFGAMVNGAEDEAVDEEELMRNSEGNGDCPSDVRRCPDGSVVGRVGNACTLAACPDSVDPVFTGKIYYSVKKSANLPAVMQKPIEFSGVANGKMSEIKVKFPEIGKSNIRTIRIQFTSGVKPGNTVALDWIRLLGAKIPGSSPTITVTPTSIEGRVVTPSPIETNITVRGILTITEKVGLFTTTYENVVADSVYGGTRLTHAPVTQEVLNTYAGKVVEAAGQRDINASPMFPVRTVLITTSVKLWDGSVTNAPTPTSVLVTTTPQVSIVPTKPDIKTSKVGTLKKFITGDGSSGVKYELIPATGKAYEVKETASVTKETIASFVGKKVKVIGDTWVNPGLLRGTMHADSIEEVL